MDQTLIGPKFSYTHSNITKIGEQNISKWPKQVNIRLNNFKVGQNVYTCKKQVEKAQPC